MRSCLLIAITAVAIMTSNGYANTQEPRLPLITAPFVIHPPTIDGHINPDEWGGASGAAAFLRYGNDRLSSEKTEFWVCHDRSALYLAWRRHQNRIPKAEVIVRDGALWSDDSVEVFFQPKQGAGLYYQFIGNAAGVFWDSEGTDGTWNGEWRYAASVTTSYWEAELCIPWTTILSKTPSEGDVLGFNMCIDNQSQPPVSDTWAPLGTASFHDAGRFGSLIIGGETPAVKIKSPVDISSSKIGAAVDITNQATEKKAVRIISEIHRGDNLLDTQSKDIDLDSNTAEPVDMMKPVGLGDYDVKVSVQDISVGSLILLAAQQINGISLGKPPMVILSPDGKRLDAVVDISGKSMLDGARFYAVLASEDRDIAGQIVTLNAGMQVVKTSLDLTRVKPGSYNLNISIVNGARRLMEYKQDVEKKK